MHLVPIDQKEPEAIIDSTYVPLHSSNPYSPEAGQCIGKKKPYCFMNLASASQPYPAVRVIEK
jgi:hypothetical protein